MDNFDKKSISSIENIQTKFEDIENQNPSTENAISNELNDLKKETKEEINHLKWDASPILNGNKSTFNQFKNKVELLQHKLELAKAETKEELIQQKKNISKGLKDIKKILTKG
jgi:hypothetical protein